MRPVIWIIVAIVAIGAVIWFVNEQNKSPLEKAADDIEDAAEDLSD